MPRPLSTAARHVIPRWPNCPASASGFLIGSCKISRASIFAALQGVAYGLTRDKSRVMLKKFDQREVVQTESKSFIAVREDEAFQAGNDGTIARRIGVSRA
jgi:hypothetical protein